MKKMLCRKQRKNIQKNRTKAKSLRAAAIIMDRFSDVFYFPNTSAISVRSSGIGSICGQTLSQEPHWIHWDAVPFP